jgi:type I restriction-modification system DNA methylase subunit
MTCIAEINDCVRQSRQKVTAEVFSPGSLINEMLDKLPLSIWEDGQTFCDPACGNGNMIIHVLYRKIAIYDHNPLEALKTIYGVDIMRDNIQETRLRLLKLVSLFEKITRKHIAAIFTNIVWVNPKKHPGGALDYDFSFRAKLKESEIDKWMQWIKDGVFAEVSLPISDESFGVVEQDIFA